MPETFYHEEEVYLANEEIKDLKWTPTYQKFLVIQKLIEELDIDTIDRASLVEKLEYAVLNLVRVLNHGSLVFYKPESEKAVAEIVNTIEAVSTEIVSKHFGRAKFLKEKKH